MNRIDRTDSQLDLDIRNFSLEALIPKISETQIKEALACRDFSKTRVYKLPPRFMIWFVILMGLYRRVSYRNLLEKIRHSLFLSSAWKGAPPTSSAVTQARDRLGVEPLRQLFAGTAESWIAETTGALFHGRRVWAIDGMTIKIPDSEENREFFGLPGSARGSAGYPQMRVLVRLDVGTHLVRNLCWGRYRKSELALFTELMDEVERGSINLIDRNFCSFKHLWTLHDARGAKFIVRKKTGKSELKTRLVQQLGPGDEIVKVLCPKGLRKRGTSLPKLWTLRQITFTPEGWSKPIILLTNLLDEGEASEIATLYFRRWGQECAHDELKTHLGDCATVNRPTLFRSEKVDRVVQELYGFLIAFNLVRLMMSEAAAVALDKPSPLRLSFSAAVERTREAIRDMMTLPTRRLSRYYADWLVAIARSRVPFRPGRHPPRAVKIKMSKYPRKRRRAA